MVCSPCIAVCDIDNENGYCKGCYRTRDEIARWSASDDYWKHTMLELLTLRKQASGSQSGFTLFEIAMVMLGVGLIIAAILTGSDVVKQATLRKQMTQMERVDSSIQNFRTKYGCMPGDCADPSVIEGYTYSGNGDGYLGSTWNSDENKGFWLHLSLSKMIEDPLVTHPALSGMKTPLMKSNPKGVINVYGNIAYKRNVMEYAMSDVSGAIKAVDIMNIDKKMDDGTATCGNIRSSGYGSGSTSIYDDDPAFPISVTNNHGFDQCVIDKVYNVKATSDECNILFLLGE